MNNLANNSKLMGADEIYESIKNRILTLKLLPGQKISENKMCQEYNISRSVIRIVFTRLEKENLIEILPQRGTYVSLFNLEHIKNLETLRTAVEKEIIYQIITVLNDEQIDDLVKKLKQNIEKQLEYNGFDYYDKEFEKIDYEFHKILYSSLGRESLLDLVSESMLHLIRWRAFNVAFDNRVKELIIEHISIIEFISEKNISEAQNAITRHLKTVAKMDKRAREQFPQYFK